MRASCADIHQQIKGRVDKDLGCNANHSVYGCKTFSKASKLTHGSYKKALPTVIQHLCSAAATMG